MDDKKHAVLTHVERDEGGGEGLLSTGTNGLSAVASVANFLNCGTRKHAKHMMQRSSYAARARAEY